MKKMRARTQKTMQRAGTGTAIKKNTETREGRNISCVEIRFRNILKIRNNIVLIGDILKIFYLTTKNHRPMEKKSQFLFMGGISWKITERQKMKKGKRNTTRGDSVEFEAINSSDTVDCVVLEG